MLKWIVKGLIPQGHILMIAGQPENGKSWWMAQLAIDVAEGRKHLGEFGVQQSNVIYIDEDTGSEQNGHIITLEDVTREQDEERRKIDFVSMAAHELRSPITGIRGYTSVLSDEATSLTEEQYPFPQRTIISADRLT